MKNIIQLIETNIVMDNGYNDSYTSIVTEQYDLYGQELTWLQEGTEGHLRKEPDPYWFYDKWLETRNPPITIESIYELKFVE